MRLFDALAAYAKTDAVPMHMPGHKRAAHDYLVGSALDITEINGFDNLHDAEGILQDAMAHAAAVWGSQHAAFCVNGSTGGILAAIHCAAGRGGEIIVAHNCHKSVWHAIELCHLFPVRITPPVVSDFDIFASISVSVVEETIENHPNARMVVITSPTYEGVVSDVAAICTAAHRHGIPVLVDEAHGAHLGFDPFPDGAVRAGADIVIQSLHKTLPSLTQTAIAHVQGELIDFPTFLRSKNIFETSSPSYLLMASCDGCAHLIDREPERFSAWSGMLEDFAARTANLQHLRIFRPDNRPDVFAFDPSKIVISTRRTTITGPMLSVRLREEFAIELEMESGSYALAMTGLGTTSEHLNRLADALIAIDKTLSRVQEKPPLLLPPTPEQAILPHDAVTAPHLRCRLSASAGKIAAGYLWAYPPGIPLIAPGQRITQELLDTIETLRRHNVRLPCEIDVCTK
ncbi:MAG: aminotransferase class V-fold PLP-dependent enzyme [Clostridia bacterium]|nr:aminotransferase class V-fold PLP-dependent enzyme [Clostridia bacterium]